MSVFYSLTLIIILCVSIGILYIINTLKYNEDSEGFADITSQTQRISSIKDIIVDPIDAESVADTFYNSLNKRNMDIRKKTVKYYNVEDISPGDRDIIRDAYQYARTTYPLPLEGQFQVVITGDETEGGYPHTHGNLIYIPLKKVKESTEHKLRNTFLHEMSHIHQRQKRYLWEKLYNNLGFQRLPIDWPVPEDIHNKILANPDTWEHGNWEYKGQHAMMLINDDAKSIRDHTYQIIPVRDGVNMSVNQLKKSFGKITKQIDHPAEVTACALQKYIDTGDAGDLNVTNAIRCWLEECRVK
jgi:hypothetical protein